MQLYTSSFKFGSLVFLTFNSPMCIDSATCWRLCRTRDTETLALPSGTRAAYENLQGVGGWEVSKTSNGTSSKKYIQQI